MKTLILALVFSVVAFGQTPITDPSDPAQLYATYCAGCHGARMEGGQYSALRKQDWMYGGDRDSMLTTVRYGIVGTDMAAWSAVLPGPQVEALVDYVVESRNTLPTEMPAKPTSLELDDYTVNIDTVIAEGFNSTPWGLEFVDENRALITERRGGLRWMVDRQLDPVPVTGLPETIQYGTGGMLDLALDPDYSNTGWVYIAYVHPLGEGPTEERPSMTRIIRGRVQGHEWVDQELLFKVGDEHYQVNKGRWGSRLLFDEAGYLYFTIGDVRMNDHVQRLDKPEGKVYRIYADGSIPEDNPYAGASGAIEAIYTVGNRNVQGIDQHPVTGKIWGTEHGPMGGDELNILEPGKNYGWPVITYGLDYDGSIVSELTHKEGMEQPIKYWKPSPGLSALEFYTGDMFPKWKNQAFVGAMVFQEIKRLKLGATSVEEEEVLLKGWGRVRDIKTGPDGAIYIVLNEPHQVLRLTR
jgi:glucose/arabinose dehydrogenase